LPLAGPKSSAEEAIDRLAGFIPPERVLVVTGAGLAGPLADRLPVPRENFLIEPRAASTGPALAWASWEAARRDPEAVVLSLHADWHVPDPAAFARTARAALDAAVHHRRLVTVGIVPTRPETGYGYIIPAAPLDDTARAVGRFAEKPTRERAEAMIREGALWNSGLFAWTARTLLEQVERWTPEIAKALPRLDRGPGDFFREIEEISIDVGVLERSDRVAVVAGQFAWDDIGTWEALTRVRPQDARGNVTVGAVVLDGVDNCVVWSESLPIVMAGVQDLVAVEANGRILIIHRSRAADLKKTLEKLPPEIRDLPS
jgi:mannose-1-phosphate guanylyltransferase